jgi:hypothetical protein
MQEKFDKEYPLFATAGNTAGINWAAVQELKAMLEQRKPATALLGKSVAIIREAADNSRSAGSVGKQISSVVIPSDFSQQVCSGYDTAVPTNKIYIGNGVIALPEGCSAFRDVLLEKVSDGPNPPSYALLPKNSPCFCGSRKKYKRCHGVPQKNQRT